MRNESKEIAWDAVWKRCIELGMKTNEPTGIACVLEFINGLADEVENAKREKVCGGCGRYMDDCDGLGSTNRKHSQLCMEVNV